MFVSVTCVLCASASADSTSAFAAAIFALRSAIVANTCLVDAAILACTATVFVKTAFVIKPIPMANALSAIKFKLFANN
ncbi:hypothetical protein MWMV16_MWMV16_02872 [Acinetobacter baumannii]|nr:hypothetical protein MWMV16_MWMV16_02872 [Acinetobacter baumannii]